jgi:hypothetical protein
VPATDGYLGTTVSTCATCGRLIAARIHTRPDGVWFHKHCPEHGPQEARVYGDAEAYRSIGRFHRQAARPLEFSTTYQGCPDSCGLCPEHEQHVCLPIIEITDHCNLDCPICLVRNPGSYHRTREEVARILEVLLKTEDHIDVLNLSGGEPTLNPHFRDIVEECVSRRRIVRVSVSTNGLTLSRDPDLLRFLAERRVIVSLQFDGLSDDIYQALRGRPMLDSKRRLIDACAQLDTPMSLTATVTTGVNDTRVAEIASLLFEYDHVLSVMFQPAAYAGNAARTERPPGAATIPDVIARLRGAGQGTVSPEDFSPLPCSHPACFSLAFYLRLDDGQFVPIKQMIQVEQYLDLIRNRALFGTDEESFHQVTDAVYALWSGPAALSPDSKKALTAVKRLLERVTACGSYQPGQAWAAAERSVKSIFIHQFMDRHTFDLSRARKCCQVYPQPDGRLMPACVFNCLKRP